jgi:hypothetical protein
MARRGERPTGKSPLAQVKKWRASDRHTGIDRHRGIPYTYRHVEARPSAGAECYRIETFIPFAPPTPIHRNVHYVPAARLDSFFDDWDEHVETIVDIRPLTVTAAFEEIRAFQADAGGPA